MPVQYDDSEAIEQMRSIIQRIATGPELSKDISFDDAYAAMGHVLDGAVDPVQSGVFLIALRMKRETEEENRGVLQALIDRTQRQSADVDDLVDVADPFDGFTRGLPASPFLPPVLAACGIATISNGAESLGPKYGVTHHQIMRAAGVSTDLGTGQVAELLATPEIGWAYLDQRAACPPLHQLRHLRHMIVKRPCLTTLEVLLRPVSGRRTHLMTGYVHKAYPPVYASMARHAGYSAAMIIKGVEGGVVPSLQQPGRWFQIGSTGEANERRLEPAMVGLTDSVHRSVPVPQPSSGRPDDLAVAAAKAGEQALRGTAGATRDSLVFAGAIALTHLGRAPSLADAAAQVRGVLDSGAALARFDALKRAFK